MTSPVPPCPGTSRPSLLPRRSPSGLFFPDLDPINAFLAISEVIGHLQWLQIQRRVVQERRLGVAHWRAVT